MKRSEAIQALSQEIAWCKCTRGMTGGSAEYEEGFIGGLQQAIRILDGDGAGPLVVVIVPETPLAAPEACALVARCCS